MPENMINQLKALINDDSGTIIAIVVGTIIRVIYKRNIKFWVAVMNIVAMIAIIIFVAPTLSSYYSVGPQELMGVGILAGMFGADIIRGLFKLGDLFANNPTALINPIKWFKSHK